VQPVESTRSGGGTRKLRPWFLVAALVLAWFVGAHGAATGCATVAILREGVIPDRTALEGDAAVTDPHGAVRLAHEAALLRAIAARRDLTFPLGVARLILSTVLVVGCAMAMAGRPGARSFALQAIFAYALFAGVDFALSRPVRADWIPEVAAAAVDIARRTETPAPSIFDFRDISVWYWMERIRFGLLEIGSMGLACAALLAPRSRAYFAAVAAEGARTRRSEEDEP
jgi:hypothetical protein